MDEKLKNQIRKAAIHYLKIKGFDILEENFNGFIVAEELDGVIFVNIIGRDHAKEFAESDKDTLRYLFEQTLCQWYIGDSDQHVDFPVRCDEISVNVVDEHRALMRHEINCIRKW